MSGFRCPGQERFRWTPDDIFEIPCPHCRVDMEFFKDEPFRACPACRKRVPNPKIDLGCAEWCKFADKCLPQAVTPSKAGGPLCEQIINSMKAVFGDDQRRIDHALAVLGYAETILESEQSEQKELSGLVVRAAAILHDIGIVEAERKHGSAAAKHQETEGPPIGRKILQDLAVPQEEIDHVCSIIANHHSAKDIDTPEFRIVWDADRLVNIPDECDVSDKACMSELIEKVFKTAGGEKIARELFKLDSRKEKQT